MRLQVEGIASKSEKLAQGAEKLKNRPRWLEQQTKNRVRDWGRRATWQASVRGWIEEFTLR